MSNTQQNEYKKISLVTIPTIDNNNEIKDETYEIDANLFGGEEPDHYKTKQTEVADSGLTGAKVLASLSQNTNGEISYSTRDLTPSDIGAQPADKYKLEQDAVDSPTTNGQALEFIDTISQNKNGVITATKKNVDLSSYKTHTENEKIFKQLQEVVSDPNANGTGTSFIHEISQDANGKITVTKKYIPGISITDDTEAEEPTTDEVSVYKNLTADGHALTETLVKVPTKRYVDREIAAAVAGAVDYLGVVNNSDELSAAAEKATHGDFVRVATAFGVYHINDLLIYNKPDENATATWDIIHGEEGDIIEVVAGNGLTEGGASGVVTLNVGEGNGITVGANSISAKAGNHITVNATGIHHNDKPTTTTEGVAAHDTTEGSGRTYVTEVLVDGYGHVAGIKTASETNQTINDGKLVLKASDGVTATEKTFTADYAGDDITFEVKHASPDGAAAGSTTPNAAQTPDYGDTFNIPVITTDKFGHVTEKSTTTVKIPEKFDVSGKADKVKNAVNGNFAGLDANGNLTDSGKNANSFDAAGTAQNKINELDVSDTAVAGQYVSQVSQTDGKIAVSRANLPTIPTHWANQALSTSSNDNTAPTFNPAFKVKVTNGIAYTPQTDWAWASPVDKYLWHDLIAFKTAIFEQSTDGIVWTTSTNENYTKGPTNKKENQTTEVVNTTTRYARWTWSGGWHACQAQWLVIGFTYQVAAAKCRIILEADNLPSNSSERKWEENLNTTHAGQSAPVWFKLNPNWINTNRIRLTLIWENLNSNGEEVTHDAKGNEYKSSLSQIKFLTARWGNQGFGSEQEYPYEWNSNQDIYPRLAKTSNLGVSSREWANVWTEKINNVSLGANPKFTDTAHTHEAGNGLELDSSEGYGTGGTTGKVKYQAKAGSGITVTANGINHYTPTTVATGNTAADRTYIKSLTFDEYGHVTGLETGEEGDQDLSGYKTTQTAIGNKINKSAHVLSSLTQDTNGNISYDVKELTPDDIGAQPAGNYQAAGNYKTTQTAVSDPTANGNATAFIDTISQDANGVITVSKKNINFSGYATEPVKNDTHTILLIGVDQTTKGATTYYSEEITADTSGSLKAKTFSVDGKATIQYNEDCIDFIFI